MCVGVNALACVGADVFCLCNALSYLVKWNKIVTSFCLLIYLFQLRTFTDWFSVFWLLLEGAGPFNWSAPSPLHTSRSPGLAPHPPVAMYTVQTASLLELSPCLARGPADWGSVGKRGGPLFDPIKHTPTSPKASRLAWAGSHTCWAWPLRTRSFASG